MRCHECAREGREQAAVAICHYCSVGLCKAHLVASYRTQVVPEYSCEHHPGRPFEAPVQAPRDREPVAAR